MDDVPDWELLSNAIKFLFAKYDFEFVDFGQVQRLDYETMEKIFYHLIMIIDPNECRRSLRLMFPARNQDERTKFINTMVIFINKRLHPDKISSSRLRMCGGAPFRRLLGTLITKAASAEIAMTLRRSSCDQPLSVDTNVSPWILVEEDRKDLIERVNLMEKKRKQLESLQDALVVIQNESDLLWNNLKNDLDCQFRNFSPKQQQLPFREFDDSSSKAISKLLLDRIECYNRRSRIAAQKIQEINLPESSNDELDLSKTGKDHEKRLSYYVRELREKLILSPEGCDGPKLIDKIHQQLRDYDDKVKVLLTKLEEKQMEEDEALLKIPEVAQKYQQLEQLIPKIYIAPLSIDCQTDPPTLDEIKGVLEQFLDSSYDKQAVFHCLEDLFES